MAKTAPCGSGVQGPGLRLKQKLSIWDPTTKKDVEGLRSWSMTATLGRCVASSAQRAATSSNGKTRQRKAAQRVLHLPGALLTGDNATVQRATGPARQVQVPSLLGPDTQRLRQPRINPARGGRIMFNRLESQLNIHSELQVQLPHHHILPLYRFQVFTNCVR
ncbi:uncharacterized protein MELLADRAFT_87221 [Melampsora larici-populina 98AG31]|uniref:Uncharacterized protein n=1 Tax=Melampsora larici-populina (strain 98AG31 / pathotype 3-4-7) TaxID=747676 RepID=F4R4Y9_MELLP|nr:uncharacterized protein MELLADRAFT_87221 [Melampsora larici-populina 98AG31]EGG12886.1 hypothetical protein MELLADRAFT_87221 [Melampsora larici-populina 98AG31]